MPVPYQFQPRCQTWLKYLSSSLFCSLKFTEVNIAKAMGDVHGKGDIEYGKSNMEFTFFTQIDFPNRSTNLQFKLWIFQMVWIFQVVLVHI